MSRQKDKVDESERRKSLRKGLKKPVDSDKQGKIRNARMIGYVVCWWRLEKLIGYSQGVTERQHPKRLKTNPSQ